MNPLERVLLIVVCLWSLVVASLLGWFNGRLAALEQRYRKQDEAGGVADGNAATRAAELKEEDMRRQEAVRDAVDRCRLMAQVPIVVAPAHWLADNDPDAGDRVVCLQAPSVAFDTGAIR